MEKLKKIFVLLSDFKTLEIIKNIMSIKGVKNVSGFFQ